MNNPKVFLSISCLTEKTNPTPANDLVKKWFKGGKVRLNNEAILQDFIRLNLILFDFLGVTPIVTGSYNDLELSFRSGNYIGAIPLKSPITGKPFADYIVYPRYLNQKENSVNDYIEIVHLLDKQISPEFIESNELLTKNHIRPPIYYECVKFVDLFFLSLRANWVKFDSKEQNFSFPKGGINWNSYIEKEWDPFQKLDFPCKVNWLNKFHSELRELIFVYNFSKLRINDQNTPIRIKAKIKKKFFILDKLLLGYKPIETEKIVIRNSDIAIIKQTKEQANKILLYENCTNQAWRVNFSEIYEKYIQYLFSSVLVKSGWSTKCNSKFENITRRTPAWSLKYLEPDLLLYKKNISIAVDAKYKSHFLNLDTNSQYLKDEHRSDLHQLISYCAFQTSTRKLGFLCYPAKKVDNKRLSYKSNISANDVAIYLLGIPISSTELISIQKEIGILFFDILKFEKFIP